jgi:hypothetical protein
VRGKKKKKGEERENVKSEIAILDIIIVCREMQNVVGPQLVGCWGPTATKKGFGHGEVYNPQCLL